MLGQGIETWYSKVPMSILRNGNVSMSILRNGNVATSIFALEGPYSKRDIETCTQVYKKLNIWMSPVINTHQWKGVSGQVW